MIPDSLYRAVTTPLFTGAIHDSIAGLMIAEFYWPLISQEARDSITATDSHLDAMDIFSDAIDAVPIEAVPIDAVL
jgi:hypothetical protein